MGKQNPRPADSRDMYAVHTGMLLQDASSEQRALFKEAVGAPVFAVMSRVGPISVKRYRDTVFSPS
ncbi:hypothetical protein ACFO4E_21905 [Nocardiopsis mangrovi]|uniref:Uncharacterized protein n=1 Tax=Nocardiopsis mangrovi TaxID=1179818 RepID=A0ABV9E033_9ACTN